MVGTGLSVTEAGRLSARKVLNECEIERLEDEEAARRAQELQKEDQEIARWMASFGLSVIRGKVISGPVKVYTPEEIAAVTPEITPISQIRQEDKDHPHSFGAF